MIAIREVKGKKGRGWEVDINVRLPDGSKVRERVRPELTSRSAALRWAQQREASIITAGGRVSVGQPAPVATVATFSERFLTFSENNNKASTLDAKRWMLRVHLLPFFGAMRLNEVGPEEVETYKSIKRKEGLNPKSINNHLTALRKLLNLAVEWGELDRSPRVRGFPLKPQPLSEDEFLTLEESDRLIAAASSEWRAMLAVAIRTGLRVGELLALRWSDVDLKAGRLVVRHTLWRDQVNTPKGGRSRAVDLCAEASTVLQAHRHLRGEYVFCGDNGAHLTHSIVKDVVPQACKRAGLAKRITWHGLRHSFASHLVMAGAPLKSVQELLGHESIEMTLRYAHLTRDARSSAVRLLDRARGELVETGAA